MANRFRNIHVELLHHLPFTVFSVAAGMIVVGFMTYGILVADGPADEPAAHTQPAEHASAEHAHDHGMQANSPTQGMFHLFHPLHVLFSASATTAMFWRFRRNWLMALLVGLVGSLAVCGISDIFMPYAAGWTLGEKMQMHICLIEDPWLIPPFAAVGLLLGFVLPTERRSTIFSHTSHVFVSSMASILYLVGFGMADWTDQAGLVFIFMILAVMLPCCLSDIILPLLAAGKDGDAAHVHEHGHDCLH